MNKNTAFTKLTHKTILSLSVGKRIVENGIAFERLADGNGVFYVFARRNNKNIFRRIGYLNEGMTPFKALRLKEQIIFEVEQSAKAQKEKDAELASQKRSNESVFVNFAETYLARLKEADGGNLVAKESHLRNHLIPFFGAMSIAHIKRDDIEKYKKKRLGERGIQTNQKTPKKPISTATVNRELATLSHMFSMAMEWELIEHLPTKVKKFKEEGRRTEYLNPEEVHNLLWVAKTGAAPYLFTIMIIGFCAGMRKNEILSIRKEHIDCDRRSIYIPKAKAGARNQLMPDFLAEHLRMCLAKDCSDSPWLFPSEQAKGGHRTCIDKAFANLIKSAGGSRKVTPHTLRHSAVSNMVHSGVDVSAVKDFSGHSSIDMVMRYTHESEARRQAMMKTYEEYMKFDERLLDED